MEQAPDSALSIAEAVAAGRVEPRRPVAAALAAVEARDPDILAWTHVDGAGALDAAGALGDRDLARLPLAGVPVGIKDIIDVAGMVTTAGAKPWAHRVAGHDAACVAKLRAAGAIILGKTATTEFAYLDPAPTRNPWNTGHTPGGSSSGSAAAVAAGMVPVAIGTQTVGSVLRPAAYCGVVGFKPGHGWTSVEGVTPLAWSLDHLGVFARSVEDATRVYTVLREVRPGRSRRPTHSRLGIPYRFFTGRASSEIHSHLEAVVAKLAGSGFATRDVELPSSEEWGAAGLPVLAVEAATFHEAAFRGHADEYRAALRELVGRGLATAAPAYVRAQRARADLRARALPLFASADALLLPVAPTTAPAGLSSTGDSVFCAPASYAGLPAISLPSGIGEGRLPLAIQLVGRPGAEEALLELAARAEAVLAFEGRA